jgi:hypothetical protein
MYVGACSHELAAWRSAQACASFGAVVVGADSGVGARGDGVAFVAGVRGAVHRRRGGRRRRGGACGGGAFAVGAVAGVQGVDFLDLAMPSGGLGVTSGRHDERAAKTP